jgi:AAT family amino acid transporter
MILAIALIIGFGSGRAAIGIGAIKNAAVFPHGIGGLAGSMLVVLLGYAGFEVIGLAASEARDPQKTVPRAIKATVISLLAIYITVIALLLPLVSTQALTTKISPMVQALNIHGFGVAAGMVNFVLVTAIISTMLASIFGLGRMLRSIADNGDAPAFLKDQGDVPLRGILFSGLVMLIGVSMSYILPDRIYIFLVSSGGFSLLFVYLIIMLTHLRFRQRSGCPPQGHCQLAGYPYTTWVAIIGLTAAIVTMPLIPGQGPGLFAGLVLIVIYSIAYPLVHRSFAYLQPAAKPILDENNCPDDSDKQDPDKQHG